MSFADIIRNPLGVQSPPMGSPSRGSGGGPDKPSIPMGSPSHGAGGGPDKPIHPPGSTPSPGPGKPPGLNPSQQSAFDLMNSFLQQWGLSSLANDLRGLIVKGDTNSDTLTLALSQTKAYKTRFAANEIRKANGMAVLSPAEYLGLERGYRQVMQAYGLPRGFYDKPQDFTNLIAGDVSVTEIESRVKIAHDQYMAAPDSFKNLWAQYFGSKGDAIASILDPKVATQVIQDRATQVQIGGYAGTHGMAVTQQRAQQLQQAGITGDQAKQAYTQIGQLMPTDQSIAQRFGTDFTQQDEENDLLLGQAGAANKRQLIYNQEKGLFEGSSGQDSSSLGTSQSTY